MLCHPPGTPPSVLAPNCALSSEESKNFNREALGFLLCLKRFIKGGCKLLRRHQDGFGRRSKVDNFQLVAGSGFFHPVKPLGSRNIISTLSPHGSGLKLQTGNTTCLLPPSTCPGRYLLVCSGLKTNKDPLAFR